MLVGVALSVGNHIDRQSIHGQSDVGAVIQIKAPQENLLGFPSPSVLADEQTRYHSQDFLGIGDGTQLHAHPTDELLIVG